MAEKYFLATVGSAEAFRVVDGKLELAFVSKTLTDSGLNIQTTKDDIRAGQGAPIQFSFYHDPSVEITLTDVLWKLDYITAQLGAKFDKNPESYITRNIEFDANGEANETATAGLPMPKELPILCDLDNGSKLVAWAAKAGTDTWGMVEVTKKPNSTEFTLKLTGKAAKGAGKYCVRYLADDDSAKVAEISTQIIPEELFLIIKAPLFAGDACSASKGEAAGSVTFEVPRFQLNGAQEFQMNMSSNQNMSLSGIALASESAECDAVGGKLLRIIEVIKNRNWAADVKDIMSDEEYEVEGQEPHIYAIMENGSVKTLKNDQLTFTPALDAGKFVVNTEEQQIDNPDYQQGGNEPEKITKTVKIDTPTVITLKDNPRATTTVTVHPKQD